MARPDFDPSDAVDFWDTDQPPGLARLRAPAEGHGSPAYAPGRYSLMEDMVHAFDLMCADRYAADGVVTRFAPRHDKWRDPAARKRSRARPGVTKPVTPRGRRPREGSKA